MSTAEEILSIYEEVAIPWDRARLKTLFERPCLDRALNLSTGRRVLDLGCGSGRPIATYLDDRRCAVTGVDGAAAMIALFQTYLPRAEAIHADMRGLDLKRQFDIVLAWNSFFHLSPADQRAMFPVFAAHAAPGAVLMFTAGPAAGEPIGEVEGRPVYHASLDPDAYRSLLDDAGFDTVSFTPEDPRCRGHSIWIARRRAIS